MPASNRVPCVWSRRSALIGLMAVSVSALSGCRIRLEDDAPRIPGVPTRQPMVDERALLSARREALRLQGIAGGLGSASTPLTISLASLHGQQADVLGAVLRDGGVPAADLAAAGTSTPATVGSSPTTVGSSPTTVGSSPTTVGSSPTTTGPTAQSPAPAPRVTELVAAETEGLAPALSGLAAISTDHVALMGSMAAQQGAAVRLLGGRVASAGALTGPAGDVAAAELAAIRSAVYGFEVVAAQADTGHRAAAARTLGMLRARSSELEVLTGPAAIPAPLGYALPFPVATPASALRLATHVMTALRRAVASQLPALAGDAAGLAGTVHLLADVSQHAVTWRVPLTAFPGLTDT